MLNFYNHQAHWNTLCEEHKGPKGYQIVSFDVKALFPNVPLQYTTDLVLKRIYENYGILTPITKNEMKEILLLCITNVHFIFRDAVYLQTDGVLHWDQY